MSKQVIIVQLPLNLTESMRPYFEKRKEYTVRIPLIQYIKNAFVSEQGLVVKNLLLNPHCAFNLLGKEDNIFYYPYWKLSLEQMFVSSYGKSLKSLKLNGKQRYLLIHSKWFNYSFWINSFLTRLLMAEEAGLLDNVVLIYPENWDNIQYVRESLSCFNVKTIKIPSGHHLFVEHLVMPETREWTASFYPPHIQNLREKILPFAIKATSLKDLPKRIYLTRKNLNVRCVENESDLIPILEKYNFTVLSFEDISFWDQVSLMNNAQAFVSIHGAGFSNVMFMKKGSKVLELINKPYADAEYQFPYWKLCSAAKLKYYAQLCNTKSGASTRLIRGGKQDKINTYLVNENIIVDVGLFKENMKKMFP